MLSIHMVDDMPKHIESGLKYLAAVKLKEQGESQQKIAEELDIDRSTVSHYLNGRNLSWNSIGVAKTITELYPLDFLTMVQVIIQDPVKIRKIVSICKKYEYDGIVNESCIGCGLCVDLCFMKAISLVSLKAQINSIHCCGCKTCENRCPTNSIKILEIEDD